jgi:hypothetical protein
MRVMFKADVSAFVRGIAQGLGAIASLYAAPRHPEPARIKISKLHESILNPREAMRSDWMQVGADIHVAIKRKSRTG